MESAIACKEAACPQIARHSGDAGTFIADNFSKLARKSGSPSAMIRLMCAPVIAACLPADATVPGFGSGNEMKNRERWIAGGSIEVRTICSSTSSFAPTSAETRKPRRRITLIHHNCQNGSTDWAARRSLDHLFRVMPSGKGAVVADPVGLSPLPPSMLQFVDRSMIRRNAPARPHRPSSARSWPDCAAIHNSRASLAAGDGRPLFGIADVTHPPGKAESDHVVENLTLGLRAMFW